MPTGPAGKAKRRELAEARRRQIGPGLYAATCIFFASTSIRTGITTHASIAYYLVALLIFVLLPIPGITIAQVAQRRAVARATARPRWHYGAFAIGYLIPFGFAAAEFVRLHGRQPSWWPNAPAERPVAELVALGLVWSVSFALAMLGRAVTWGTLRRYFWFHPPVWLADRDAQ